MNFSKTLSAATVLRRIIRGALARGMIARYDSPGLRNFSKKGGTRPPSPREVNSRGSSPGVGRFAPSGLPSLFPRLIEMVLAFVLLQIPLAASDLFSDPLKMFAEEVLKANREIEAARQDLEASRQEYKKVPTRFQPVLTLSEDSSKAANRNYNSLTGIDEDYTTRQQGSQVSIKQETPIGTSRLEISRSRTAYTQAQNSYFQSAYLTLDRDVLKNPNRKIKIEKRLGRGQFNAAETRTDAAIQQTLLEAFRALFDRIIAHEEFEFKRRSLTFYQNLVTEADLKLSNGLGSELDLKQARMRQSNAETGMEQSRLSLEESDRRLGLVLGNAEWERSLASFTPGSIASLVPEKLDGETILRDGLLKRFEIRQANTQLSLQRDSLNRAREGARPDVSLSVRWGRQGRATIEEMARDMRDKSWEVMLSWAQPLGHRAELFDRKAESIKLTATTLRRDQAVEERPKSGRRSAIACWIPPAASTGSFRRCAPFRRGFGRSAA